MMFQECLITRALLELCGTALLAYTVGFAVSSQLSTISAALSMGVCVSTLIHIIGRYSGAHLNPAVTLVLGVHSSGLRDVLSKKFLLQTGSYILAQVIGSMVGFAVFLSSSSTDLPASRIDGSGEELVLTVVLLLLILTWAKEGRLCPFAQPLTGIVIGTGIAFLSILGGSTSCGILNPAIAISLMMYTDMQGLSSIFASECMSVLLVCCFIFVSRRWSN